MSDLDDFIKKTEDEITKAKADAKAKDDAEREMRSKIETLVQAEWPTLLPSMRTATVGKKLGDQAFFDYGTNGLILGVSVVNVTTKRNAYEAPRFVAVFQVSRDVSQESEVLLTPSVVDDKLRWTATGINGSLSTKELADKLVMKLIEVYKSTALPK